MKTEREFLGPGLPKRPYFQHVIQAPGPFSLPPPSSLLSLSLSQQHLMLTKHWLLCVCDLSIRFVFGLWGRHVPWCKAVHQGQGLEASPTASSRPCHPN